MKNIVILLSLLTVMFGCSSSVHYDPSADAREDIKQALIVAKTKQQPVAIFFGADWCPGCRALSKDLAQGPDAKKIADAFQIVKVNVGNFDTNLAVANDYGNPISGSIPGAALLSSDGKLVYVTKVDELDSIGPNANESLYQFLARHLL